MSNYFKFNRIFIFYFLFLFFLPVLFVIVNAEFIQIVYISLISIFILFYERFLVRNELFWFIYYIFLSSIYFLLGFNDLEKDNVLNAKILIGFLQFLPFMLFIKFLLNEKFFYFFMKNMFILIYLVYLIYAVSRHGISLNSIVAFRNFSIFIFSFYIGVFLSNYIPVGKFYKYILFLMLFYIIVGFILWYSTGWFWKDYFNGEFVCNLKGAGYNERLGMIGNLTTQIKGEVYYRMNSVYIEPHHFAFTLSYLLVFLVVLKKYHLLKMSYFLYIFLLVFLLLSLFFTLVKASIGYVVLVFFIVMFLTVNRNRFKKIKRISFFKLLLAGLSFLIILSYFLVKLSLGSTAITHIKAALSVFNINWINLIFGNGGISLLNSDSGFASMVFSIGIVGYILFMLAISEICFLIYRNNVVFKKYLVAMIIAWFGVIHLISYFSPMITFLLFFLIGLSIKYNKEYYANIINK